MTTVKTNEIIKFKVASEIPNIEKSTSLQSGLILFRDLSIFSFSRALIFSPVHENIGSINPSSTVSYTHLTLPTIYSV